MEYANLFLIFACLVFLIQLLIVKRRFKNLNSFIQQLNNIYNIKAKIIPQPVKEEHILPNFVIKLIEIVSFIVLGILVFFIGGFVATLISITMI
jgi:hypothetical protein